MYPMFQKSTLLDVCDVIKKKKINCNVIGPGLSRLDDML